MGKASKSPDYLAVLEAAYRQTGAEHDWVTEIARAVRPMVDQGLGVVVYTYEVGKPAPLRFGPMGVAGGSPWLGKLAHDFAESLSEAEVERLYAASAPVEPLSRIQSTMPLGPAPVQVMLSRQVVDAFGLRAHNAQQRSMLIIGCTRSPCKSPSSRQKAVLGRVAAHLAAATRLRFAGVTDVDSAEGVLSPTGKLQHAGGAGEVVSARAVLEAAVQSRSLARKLRLQDGNRALDLWRALVAGRWSLVDHVDRDGKRFVLARPNATRVGEPAALTPKERLVALYTSWGHSNKLIAYELGLAPSTTSGLLQSAMRKLRVRSRLQLAQLFSGPLELEDARRR
jgi:DNA-binding CsgD family transcriptional regulator